jgi:hypothetical protein
MVGPVLVMVEPARTAKLSAVPSPTGDWAARDVELTATKKADRTISTTTAVMLRVVDR